MGSVHENSEQSIAKRLRGHDVSAFTELYHRHSSRVLAHLLHRVEAQDAEDLTAEVFIAAWRRASDLSTRSDDELLPWLLVCANNLLRNQARSLRRARAALSRVVAEPTSVPDVLDGVDDRVDSIRRIQALRGVLERLDVGDRELITLSAVQGLSAADIARETGEAAGTVRSRLSRALTKLRRLSEEEASLQHSTLRGGRT